MSLWQVPLRQWVVVVTKRDRAKAAEFVNMMKRVAPPMGIEVWRMGVQRYGIETAVLRSRMPGLWRFQMTERTPTCRPFVLRSVQSYSWWSLSSPPPEMTGERVAASVNISVCAPQYLVTGVFYKDRFHLPYLLLNSLILFPHSDMQL